MSSRIISELGCIHMLEPISASPGEDDTTLCLRGFRVFLLRSFFGMEASFFSRISFVIYGRARLAMEGKSVVPMSIPVSVYRYLGLLWSSLGKDTWQALMSPFSSSVQDGTKQMALGLQTDRDTLCMSEREFCHHQNNCRL